MKRRRSRRRGTRGTRRRRLRRRRMGSRIKRYGSSRGGIRL